MGKYNRSLMELKSQAVLHWPEEILADAGDESVLPLLLKTQDDFISLLKVANATPEAWKGVLSKNKTLTPAIFLKHLMVLSDLGGEALNKLTPISRYCPNATLEYIWRKADHEYKFRKIDKKSNLTNTGLKIGSKHLLKYHFSDKMKDVAMLILYGALGTNDTLPAEVKEKCIVGGLAESPDELDKFVKENYIRVSRQVGGATANSTGQFAQKYVLKILLASLPFDWKVMSNSTLTGVGASEKSNGTNFDLVVISPKKKEFGIEVSFQVTTNSTIERKAREAEGLMRAVHNAGHKICYVVDGAGNILVRKSAVSKICNHSDCTVAMSREEIEHLANFCLEVG